ncbi:MAG: AraC family transcriptional regulator [Saccharofermentanales bacterium]|jgi:AraC-like DNA-binding protein
MIQCFVTDKYVSEFQSGLPRLISASKMDSRYKSAHPRVLHRHDSLLEILYARSGSGVYIIENKRYNIVRGDLVINNAGVLHDEDASMNKNLNMYCVSVTNLHVSGLPFNCLIPDGVSPVFSAGEYSNIVEKLMSMIYILLVTRQKDFIEVCTHIMTALVYLLLRLIERNKNKMINNIPTTNKDYIALKVKNYIDSHFDEKITLKSISDSICVSQSYLSHAFKEITGYSPIQYTIRRRLGEAQSLLSMTDLPISEIAFRLGFDNQSHFHSLFKKYIGMTPGQYRSTYSN